MKKLFVFLALLMAMLALSTSGAYASDGDLFSVWKSDGNEFRIRSSGIISGEKVLTETATTSDTVTTAETGKIFLPNISTGNITFTLPTAAAGLKYTFTSINGNAVAGQGRVYLKPASTDKFVGCVNSTAGTTFANEDKLYSPGATGDSVTLVGASTYWYCTSRVGTWVDGN